MFGEYKPRGPYRVLLRAKRSRNRRAIQLAVEQLTTLHPQIHVEWFGGSEVKVYCTNRKQANVLASKFNGTIAYCIKYRYTHYQEGQRKREAIYDMLRQRGFKYPDKVCDQFESLQRTDDHTTYDITTCHLHVPCRQTAVMAKLSIPDLMSC